MFQDFFLDNRYSKWYLALVGQAQAQSRTKLKKSDPLYIYYENHHIIPRSIFKNNDTVLLTPKEHFICHLLLTRMCRSRRDQMRMLNAFQMMANTRNIGRVTSAIYQKLKYEISQAKSELSKGELNHFYGKTHSDEFKAQQSNRMKGRVGELNSNYGNTWTDEQKALLSVLKSNPSEETRRRMREAQRNRQPMSDDTRKKISNSLIGREFSDQTRKIISDQKKGRGNPMFGKSEASAHLLRFSREMKGKKRDSETTLRIKQNKLKRMCEILYQHYDVITDDVVCEAKKLGILSKTYPKDTKKIIEGLGLIPPKKV